MTVRAFRLTRTSRLSSALTEEGAGKHGGRWNGPGTRVVYTSGSLSLAILEIMVHLDDYATLVGSYSFVAVEIPSRLIIAVERKPKGWNSNPPGAAFQRVGDAWASTLRSAVLSVPSVLAPGERNYLLNPRHPDFPRIRIGRFQRLPFDNRFIKRWRRGGARAEPAPAPEPDWGRQENAGLPARACILFSARP